MKYNAIQTSELVVMENGLKFEIKRIFYLCKKYIGYDLNGIIRLVNKFNDEKNVKTYVIAIKYGVIAKPFNLRFSKMEIADANELSFPSDWNVNKLISTEHPILEKDVDPVILVMSDKKHLNYRISYYCDLVRSGMSKEEALKTIFS